MLMSNVLENFDHVKSNLSVLCQSYLRIKKFFKKFVELSLQT